MFRPYPPIPPKINVLVKPKLEEKNISKTLRAIQIFVFISLSLNFGVLESKSMTVNFLAKTFCVLKTLGVGFYLVFSYIVPLGDSVIIFWYCTYIIESFVLVFTLLFLKRTTFVGFYKDLLLIDVEMKKDYSYRPEFIIIIGMTLCLSYVFLLSLIYCIFFDDYCISPVSTLVLFDLILLCNDAFLIVFFVIYYSLYCRLKNFTSIMKNGNSNVVSNHFLYKSMADVYDDVKVLYNPLYVVPLVFHTVGMMITIFYPLLQMDQEKTSLRDILSANLSVLQVFVLLFAPAFASGLLASQVEKLRLVLLDRLLREREEKQRKDIERFIRYIEVRPMKTVICKVIPLDWKLPVSVLNICVTYLIVMLQFTHKY